jgi:hypothetical protein
MGRVRSQEPRRAVIESTAIYGVVLGILTFGFGLIEASGTQTAEMILVNGTLSIFATLGHATTAGFGLLRIVEIDRKKRLRRSVSSALLFFFLWISGGFSSLAVCVRPLLGSSLSQLALFTALCGAWMSVVGCRLRWPLNGRKAER